MTDVLEIMALAAINEGRGFDDQFTLEEIKHEQYASMWTMAKAEVRAALLALAEADISRDMIDAGLEDDDVARRFEDAFRSICRSLAEGE
jgi:hypothetical protein